MEYGVEEQKWSNQFAWHIVRLCKRKNTSMTKLFQDIGINKREKDRIIEGSNPKLHTLCKIAKGLKIDLSVLLDFSKEKTHPFCWNVFNKEEPWIKRTIKRKPIVKEKVI